MAFDSILQIDFCRWKLFIFQVEITKYCCPKWHFCVFYRWIFTCGNYLFSGGNYKIVLPHMAFFECSAVEFFRWKLQNSVTTNGILQTRIYSETFFRWNLQNSVATNGMFSNIVARDDYFPSITHKTKLDVCSLN